MDADNTAVDDAGVEANALLTQNTEFLRVTGQLDVVDGSALRLPVLGGVLGVQAHFDRMPTDLRLIVRKCFT